MSFLSRFVNKVKQDSEKGAKKAVLEDLFNDFNRSQAAVYKFNFFRGIAFGLGSVLGGTVVLGLIVWLLNGIGWLVPGVGGFVDQVIDVVQK